MPLWSYSNTSLQEMPHMIEPRRVLTRGGSVLKPLNSVKDHRKPVRLPSRLLGRLRARSRFTFLSRSSIRPRLGWRYVHLCFSLSVSYGPFGRTGSSSRLFHARSPPRTTRWDHYDLVAAGLMSRHRRNRRSTGHAISSKDRQGDANSHRLNDSLYIWNLNGVLVGF